MTDDLLTARALEIFNENRDDYHIGPPPRSWALKFAHSSGRIFTLAFSDHMPNKNVTEILDRMNEAAAAETLEGMRAMLSFAQAVHDEMEVAHHIGSQGEA